MEEWEKKTKRNDKWIDNQIGDEGAKTISESLKINTSLTTLFLESDEKGRRNEQNEERDNESMFRQQNR